MTDNTKTSFTPLSRPSPLSLSSNPNKDTGTNKSDGAADAGSAFGEGDISNHVQSKEISNISLIATPPTTTSASSLAAVPATPMPNSHHPPAVTEENDDDDDDDGSDDTSDLMQPLVASSSPISPATPANNNNDSSGTATTASSAFSIRSRARTPSYDDDSTSNTKKRRNKRRHHRRRRRSKHSKPSSSSEANKHAARVAFYKCCDNDYTRDIVRSTLTVMHFLGRVLLWSSVFATAAGVVWYSMELKNNGTDPHLIAWFSAGAFVILGFPISIYGIVMHLLNYYQPNVQCYVVRILWMVPLYSIESWLCLRFHKYAIYIETLRDCYESYVLYNFLQFLIEILGGENELILMLKDKSPTRGVHLKPLNWCIRPWLMGQPVSRRTSYLPMIPMTKTLRHGTGVNDADLLVGRGGGVKRKGKKEQEVRPVKNVQWTSPFFVQCKFGVLQYVLLKFVSAIITMILEIYGVYKEGDFTPKGGYLYICIVTNLSQCWALYCLAFFYYATKNELGPIRPVGKFLSVKAVVFFTWWQSFMIAIVSQMGLIPSYTDKDGKTELTSEDVAKGLQDYLICIEMFIGAIVHTFVFPHTDYLVPMGGLLGTGRNALAGGGGKRIGRKGRPWNTSLMHQYYRDDRSASSKNSALTDNTDIEMGSIGLMKGRRPSLNSLSTSGGQQPPVSPMKSDSDTMNDNEMNVGPGSGNMPVLEEKDNEENYDIFFNDETMAANRMKREGKKGVDNTKDQNNTQEEEDHSVHSSQGSIFDYEDDDDDHSSTYRDRTDSESSLHLTPEQQKKQKRTGFVRAFLDSTVPRDVVDGTVGIVKGDFNVEKKTLLHHAATSDEYDLFSKSSKRRRAAAAAARTKTRMAAGGANTTANPSSAITRAKSPKELA